ncbi:MAG TPA: glycoside hydrolase family 1 protein [Candidatus Dormibacteraeota bacterium]|nr:glycoside hydrolase family 1 protein [Candidatus Dormibacteraeota bacterium]
MGVHSAAAPRQAGERRRVVARSFPKGFLWGTSSAAHQVEGDNKNCDWWEWEQQPGHIANGDTSAVACDHYHRYREDFAILRDLNQNAHRLSIEWSRIEPSEGVFDPRQIRHYRDVLGELREQGMTPMVTLHHFTSPLWFVRKGGWTAQGSEKAFLPFVRRVADDLGDLVGMWCTINEPTIYGVNGWISGEFPPGRRGDIAAQYVVTSHLRRAHELAYVALKRRWPDTPVGLSHHKFLLMPATRRRRDRLAAAAAQLVTDMWPVGPGRLRRVVDATCDYIGIAHYWGQMCALDLRRPGEQFIRRFNPPDAMVTEMGWASNPVWMRQVLNEMRRFGKPVYITENGIATNDDSTREQYVGDILANVLAAINDGVDVRGYFHWSNMDNFEWARGYAPHFGLIAVDRKTLERTVKPSGLSYARIAAANALPS